MISDARVLCCLDQLRGSAREMHNSAEEYYDHLMEERQAWPLQADGSAVTIADGLARIVATREFVEPFGFFGQEQLARWSPPLR